MSNRDTDGAKKSSEKRNANKKRVVVVENENAATQEQSVLVNEQPQSLGDHYETCPFDLKFMLERYCCRQHDVILDPFVCNGFSQLYMQHLGYQVAAPPVDFDFFTATEAPPETDRIWLTVCDALAL